MISAVTIAAAADSFAVLLDALIDQPIGSPP